MLAEDRTTSNLTLFCKGERVCSFAFRSLPEKSDEYREVVADASMVLLVCMAESSGEPPRDVRQVLEVLRQTSDAPTVYPLLLLGTEPTPAERTFLEWDGMGLSLGVPADAPYGMNALLAKCQSWMVREEGTSPFQACGCSWLGFFFSIEGRMSPGAWLFANSAMGVIVVLVTFVLFMEDSVSIIGIPHSSPRTSGTIFMEDSVSIIGIPLCILWICGMFTTTVRRLHDMGAPGILLLPGIFTSLVGALVKAKTGDTIIIVEGREWSSLAWLGAACAVALVHLLVMLWPGDTGKNKYGDPPEL